MEQEEVRKKLIEYCESKGIKYSFIATKLNVNRSTICRFKNADLDLRVDLLYKLNNLIK